MMIIKPVPPILILLVISLVLLVAFAVCQEDEPTRKYYCRIPLDCESDDSPYSSEHECKVTTSALITAAVPEPNEPILILKIETEATDSWFESTTRRWTCNNCLKEFEDKDYETYMAHFCLDPKVRELVLGGIREAVQGIIDQGYTLDPNAASEGRIEFIEPNKPKPDTTKLVGGIKTIAEFIEYYHER